MGFLIRRVVGLTYSVHFLSKSIPQPLDLIVSWYKWGQGAKVKATSQATRATLQRGLWWDSPKSDMNQPTLPPGRGDRADFEVCAALWDSGGPCQNASPAAPELDWQALAETEASGYAALASWGESESPVPA